MIRRSRWLWRWGTARRATAAAFLILLVLGRYEWFSWFKGSTTATKAFGLVPFVDPLAAVEVMLASATLPFELALGAAILVTLCLVLGPVFCGWLCPFGFLLDINQWLRSRFARLLRIQPRARHDRGLPIAWRYALLGMFLAFAFIGGIPLFQLLSPINAVALSLILGPTLAFMGVLAILVVELFLPRLWCRSLCPLGALYGILGRYSLLKVRIDPVKAGQTPCSQCTVHCPAGVRVMEEYTLRGKEAVDDVLCTRCGECVDVRPSGVLHLGFRQPACLTRRRCESA